MKTAIRKLGNSHGVLIPKPMLAEVGVELNSHVEMKVDGGRIVISPLSQDPRSNWGEECRAIAEAGEDALVWPEMGHEDDADWVWDEAR